MKGPWKISRVDRLNFYPLPFFRSRKKGKERKEKQNDEANENIDAHTLERTRMGENFAVTRLQRDHKIHIVRTLLLVSIQMQISTRLAT